MKQENKWRTSLVRKLRLEGLHAMQLDVAHSPGMPDILVCGKKVIFIELKEIDLKKDRNVSFEYLFEPSQIIWYRKYCAARQEGLYVAIRVRGGDDKYYLIIEITKTMIEKITKRISIATILADNYGRRGSEEQLIHYIKDRVRNFTAERS